jgi:hypothetical protein
MKVSKVECFKSVTITLETEKELKALKEIIEYMGSTVNNSPAVCYYSNYHIDHLSDAAKAVRRTLRNNL